MDDRLKKEFYNKLDMDKIKINWNKNPIKMKDFLSWLTVPVEKSNDHLGACSGWTMYENKTLNLIVGGGIVNGVEYLDSLQYGSKLSNPYNNYVNPFYLFDILTKEGRKFFMDYYAEDSYVAIGKVKDRIRYLEKELLAKKDLYDEIDAEIKRLVKEVE